MNPKDPKKLTLIDLDALDEVVGGAEGSVQQASFGDNGGGGDFGGGGGDFGGGGGDFGGGGGDFGGGGGDFGGGGGDF